MTGVAWDAVVASYEDAEVYHTAAWLEYLAASQGAEPVVAEVSVDGRPVGYFVGAIVRRLGVRVLGSPLRGWGRNAWASFSTTESTGGPWRTRSSRSAFHDLRCLHVEAGRPEAVEGADGGVDVRRGARPSYAIDLTKSEDALLQAMQPKTVRRSARHFAAAASRDTADAAFADEFHAFLTETFAMQGIGPTYDVGRVRQLIASLHGTGLCSCSACARRRGRYWRRGSLWVVVESPCPGDSRWIDPTTS